MYNCVICRYHEIAIKGDNRSMFENKLVENMRLRLSSLKDVSIDKIRGRIYVRRTSENPFSEGEIEILKSGLSKAFGLESFSPALECEASEEAIFSAVERSLKPVFEKAFQGKKGKVSFAVRARRSDKSFPLRSKQIEIMSAEIVEKLFGAERLSVDLMNPDIFIGVEVRERGAFVYYDSYAGPGGLPVGSNSPVLALLSGGIDSPVACYLSMKRGCHVDYLTFHSHPYTPLDSVEKVKRIATAMNGYQSPGRLYSCNLSEIQKMIRDLCTPKYRTVLYRRMMLRIAEMLCSRNGLFAVVTGECVGQVASQTIINLSTIAAASSMLVLRPMTGMDKSESVSFAKKIGTYPISIEQVPDSCTVFAPPAPAVAAKLHFVELDEKKLGDWPAVLEQIYSKIEIFDFDGQSYSPVDRKSSVDSSSEAPSE